MFNLYNLKRSGAIKHLLGNDSWMVSLETATSSTGDENIRMLQAETENDPDDPSAQPQSDANTANDSQASQSNIMNGGAEI